MGHRLFSEGKSDGRRCNDTIAYVTPALELYRPSDEIRAHGAEEFPALRLRVHSSPTLMYACRALVDRLMRFLRRFCEVHLLTDSHFDLDAEGHMTRWTIVNVEQRWIESLPARCGVSAAEFCALMRQHGSEHTVAKMLRGKGAKIDASAVRQVHFQFQHHARRRDFCSDHPELFQDVPRERPSATVLKFPPERSRNGAGIAKIAQLRDAGLNKKAKPQQRRRTIQQSDNDHNVTESQHRAAVPQLVSLRTWFVARFLGQTFDGKQVRQ
jgi:hypothetical protein